MFAKSQRIGSFDLRTWLSSPHRRFVCDQFTAFYKPSKGFHCAIVVSKKIDKRATRRNHLRRHLSHQLKQTLIFLKPVDCIIIHNSTTSSTLSNVINFSNHVLNHLSH